MRTRSWTGMATGWARTGTTSGPPRRGRGRPPASRDAGAIPVATAGLPYPVAVAVPVPWPLPLPLPLSHAGAVAARCPRVEARAVPARRPRPRVRSRPDRAPAPAPRSRRSRPAAPSPRPCGRPARPRAGSASSVQMPAVSSNTLGKTTTSIEPWRSSSVATAIVDLHLVMTRRTARDDAADHDALLVQLLAHVR